MKVRPARAGSLESAMAEVCEVDSREALIDLLQQRGYPASDLNVTIAHYCHDDRIGWNTHLVCVDGHGALFADRKGFP